MDIARRSLLVTGGVLIGAGLTPVPVGAVPVTGAAGVARPRWIWYPGQLAAHRHARRVKLAVERCTHVGYPGNFRQPLTHGWFRKTGANAADRVVRWRGPAGRIRLSVGGAERDITDRERMFRGGTRDIVAQIDFADTMPCLLLDGGDFSTGPGWEASLDGIHWVPAETSDFADPDRLPDAGREEVRVLPVVEAIPPRPADGVHVAGPGRDVVVDFRETEIGTLRFDVSGEGTLNVVVGESLAEVRDGDPRWFEQTALPAIPLGTASAAIRLPERALRYARFTTRGSARIGAVRFDAKIWPATEHGTFECSDPELNAIWRVAVATLRSNMHDFYLDGIRRDGLVWHDGPQALEAFERVFFDADLSRQTLIAQTLPERPGPRDIGIIDSQMYTLIGFGTEYRVRGDIGFATMFRDRIDDMLDFYASRQDARGFVDARAIQPYGYFPDWSATRQSGPDAKGTPAYGQMLLAAAFAAGATLTAHWDAAAAARHAGIAARLRASIRATFRDPATGLYAGGIDRKGVADPRITSFAQAFAIAFDIADPTERAPLFALLNDPARRSTMMSLSQVVELAAYARAGETQAGIARLKRSWLPLLKQGYRRFFEDIDPTRSDAAQLAKYSRRYGNSLCHVWAGAAPVLLLSKGVLGIEATKPGYAEVAVRPRPGGLAWGKGTVPTPHGPIAIEWTGSAASVTLPPGVDAILPDGRRARGGRRHGFRLNGAVRSGA